MLIKRLRTDDNRDLANLLKIDQWTDWQVVRETYARKPGFARVIDKTPAAIDLSALPAGLGFKYEFKTQRPKGTQAQPIMDRVVLSFKGRKQ